MVDEFRKLIRLWKGTFRSPSTVLAPQLVILLAWSALFDATFAGADYILLPQHPHSMSSIEEIVSLTMWGWIILISSAIAVIGWMFRCWPLAILGHSTIGTSAAAFGIGLIWQGMNDIASAGMRDGVMFIFVRTTVEVVVVLSLWRKWDLDRSDDT